MVTVSIMLATIMQVLDTTIANVALPHMQGSLSASQNQIAWVLTSYIIASAIMTLPVGWLSGRYGRKKVFVISVAGFIVGSMLCGASASIEQMVFFRILQGAKVIMDVDHGDRSGRVPQHTPLSRHVSATRPGLFRHRRAHPVDVGQRDASRAEFRAQGPIAAQRTLRADRVVPRWIPAAARYARGLRVFPA